MEVIVCCTKDCEEKVEYYNTSEDSYYCEECAYTMFNPGECVKLCNSSIIKLVIRLNKRIIREILDYTRQEQLIFKWKHLLEQLRVFKDEIQRIEEELEDILKVKRLKDLQNLLLRSHYIKCIKIN